MINKVRDRLQFEIERQIMAERLWPRLGLLKPFPKQQAVLDAWLNGAQYILLRCGRRGAKTVTASMPIVPETAFPPPGYLPKRMLLHTGPDADVTDRVGGYLWSWIVKGKLWDFRPRTASERERYIELPWGVRVEGKTTKSTGGGSPDHLLGEGIVGTICDEHARDRKNILPEYILPPLADHNGWVIIPTTPKGRRNHLYDTEKAWKAKMEAGDKRYYVAHWTSWENPYINHQLLQDFKEYCERTEQPELYAQEILAEYTSITGSIYRTFKPTRGTEQWHVDKVDYIPGLPIELGIDWGTDHPFAVIFGQIVDGDCLNIFDVISEVGLDPLQMVDKTLEKLAQYNVPYQPHQRCPDNPAKLVHMAYCDPSGLGNKKLFLNSGFRIFDPSPKDKANLNDVYAGILEVSKLFARQYAPACRIDSKCVDLIEGIENYVWKENADRQPLKLDDDECDALRYLVMGALGLKSISKAIHRFGGERGEALIGY